MLPRNHPVIVEAEAATSQDADIPQIREWVSSLGWGNADAAAPKYFDIFHPEYMNSDLSVHDDRCGNATVRGFTVIFYLEVPEQGGGLTIFPQKERCTMPAKDTRACSEAFTIKTQHPLGVQVIKFPWGTWHRPEKWAGRRRILTVFVPAAG